VTNLPYRYQIHAYGNSVGARSTDFPMSVCRRYNFLSNNLMAHFGFTFCQGIRKAFSKNLAKFSMSLSSPTLKDACKLTQSVPIPKRDFKKIFWFVQKLNTQIIYFKRDQLPVPRAAIVYARINMDYINYTSVETYSNRGFLFVTQLWCFLWTTRDRIQMVFVNQPKRPWHIAVF
jgi:hypothetical protein